MSVVRLLALFGFAAALIACAAAEERNIWPVHVAQQDVAGHVTSWESAGPSIFEHPAENGGTTSGFRPFFIRTTDATGLTTEAAVLYPIFIYRADSDTY